MITRAILAAIAGLALAAPAQAATVSVNGSSVVFAAAPGEANNVRVTFGPDNVVIQDGTAPTPGAGCAASEFNGVNCPRTAATTIDLRFGDGNDRMSPPSSTVTDARFHIDGGTGKDLLWGGGGRDTINGNAGNDSLYGQGGKDTLSGGAGKDRIQGQGTLKGGAGSDFIDALLGDNLSKTLVSKLFGGAGKDHFVTGNGAKEIVDCGSGDDQVSSPLPNGRRDRRDKIKRNCEHRL
jgi:hypothetical protein